MPLRTVLVLTDADRRRLGRDGLLAWVAALPLVMAVAVRAGLPRLADALEGHGIMIGPWLPQLRAVALAVVVPLMIGVVVGFMLLEEKQDRVWVALAVTEVSLRRYLAWRAATCLTAAALVTFACLRIAGPAGLGVGRTAWAAVGAAPLAGAVALGVMQQIVRAFGQVLEAFQFLVRSWPTIVELMSIYKRLKGFEHHIVAAQAEN